MLRNTYHSEEESELRIHSHHISVHEHKLGFTFLPTHEDNCNLLSSHGENGQLYPVEFVEASPAPRLSQTLVDPTKPSEVHLIGAVEHDYVLSQSPPHIFDGLCLAGASWSCWSPTH